MSCYPYVRKMWHVYPKFFAPEMCDSILAEVEHIKFKDGAIGSDADWITGAPKVFPEIRSAQTRTFDKFTLDKNGEFGFKDLYDVVNHKIEECNSQYFGFHTTHLTAMNVTTYRTDRLGHYSWHTDTFMEPSKPTQRKLSVVVQLSDPNDYEGGNLEIDLLNSSNNHLDPESIRERGTMIVFCSLLPHRVTPITKGIRHSLVGWKEGPLWQ